MEQTKLTRPVANAVEPKALGETQRPASESDEPLREEDERITPEDLDRLAEHERSQKRRRAA